MCFSTQGCFVDKLQNMMAANLVHFAIFEIGTFSFSFKWKSGKRCLVDTVHFSFLASLLLGAVSFLFA